MAEETRVTKTTTSTDRGVEPQPSGSVLGQRVVYLIIGIVEGLLAIRFVLSMLGANRGNIFANFVYDLTAPLVAPFQTLFSYQMQYGVSRFELETVVAMLIVALIGYVVLALFRLPQRSNEV